MPELLSPELAACRLCPRLVAWREEVGRVKRKAFQDEDYWAKPVPGFGDLQARILLLGLAPSAHGSNRTGRMFTGDASGNFLFPALYRTGFASQAEAIHREDGLTLCDMFITAVGRCVPPGNKPARGELNNCRTWLHEDLQQLGKLKLIIALGSIAHDGYLDYLKAQGHPLVKKHYPFAHGNLHHIAGGLPMLDAYHVSFQNTNTGKLSETMFDALLEQAKAFISS